MSPLQQYICRDPAKLESPGFLPQYTGFKNLKILKDINKKISDEDVRQMLIKVGLDPNLKTKVKNYSLGMIQRLGIAQALMENPKFVIYWCFSMFQHLY